ncbi:hypothetical protein [Halonotius roseus]|uniref:Uncharacterized protein n=1 Tax=Halonotius roseus TaxID=2511997 RepID=A0A544QR10_9EURY|nr:hypothetical protein [Halonotius roseus]TQQ81883.1 hypothetical protein EWF95_02795 [Halonotius roseus]
MENWHLLADCSNFLKWQYKDTPYRVVATLHEDRGHWRAVFTSVYAGDSYLIRGACGGAGGGRMMAKAAATNWMAQNPNGCSPPGDYGR